MRMPVFGLMLAGTLALTACSAHDGDTSIKKATPPMPGKVLFVGWDGVRADAAQKARTPFLDSLRVQGAWTYFASTQTGSVAVSAPGWASIFTGVQPAKHAVITNGFFPRHDMAYPSFPKRAQAELGLKTAAACVWDDLCQNFFGREGSLDAVAGGNEDQVADQVAAWVTAGAQDLFLVVFDAPDHAGHTTGFSPGNTNYVAAIEATDARMGRILAAVNGRPNRAGERWLVVVTTDHGGEGTGHGDQNAANQTVFLMVSGDGVTPGELPAAGVRNLDVHPTVMQFLGLRSQPAWGLDSRSIALR